MKKILLMLLAAAALFTANAQVTTSSISGAVTDQGGSPSAGVAVIAIHVPSGTEYGTATDLKGNFRLHNLRPGGPYAITFRMLGYKTYVMSDVQLVLGDNFVINPALTEESTSISTVTVTAGRNPIMNSDRTGSLTNINSRELTTLPSVNRSVSDFIRLTPQAGNDMSFAGRDGRYNNLTVDGASFNNRFGLDAKLPGGAAQPISLDAIQEITVNLSPYDIRESNFTGASINAITRSGDNELHSSVYAYIRPKSFYGEKVEGKTLSSKNDMQSQNYGLTLSGPIVKNKLFFFINGEWERSEKPLTYFTPSDSSVSGPVTLETNSVNKSRVSTKDLDDVSKRLRDVYKYDTGGYDQPQNTPENYKILARIDWNINSTNKLMVRYNEIKSTNSVIVNASSGPSSQLGDISAGRVGTKAFSFANSNYDFLDRVRSITAELNSSFSNTVSNKLLATYTYLESSRTTPSTDFPFIDIMYDENTDPAKDPNYTIYMSAGQELYSANNHIYNHSFTISDNLSISLENHSLTIGAAFEYQKLQNFFYQFGSSYYRYASVDDFLQDKAPIGFAITYPYDAIGNAADEISFGMPSIYIQDEWKVSRKFKLTMGLRYETPIFLSSLSTPTHLKKGSNPDSYPLVSDLEFYKGQTYDIGKWPRQSIYVSPRLGFNWDVAGDRSIQLRGGTGIFLGYNPFVWFTNQPGSSGYVHSATMAYSGSNVPANIRSGGFNPDWRSVVKNNSDVFPQTPGLIGTGSDVCKIDDDFKLPQIWRSSLATDIKLPWNTILTLEAIYSKDINAIRQYNANLAEPSGYFSGSDNRPYWWGSSDASKSNGKTLDNKVLSDIGGMMVLTNTHKGHQMTLTAQLTKRFTNGWSGMIAYTYNRSKDVTSNPGSRAYSAWSSNVAVNSLNDEEMGWSLFSAPHRVNGYVSYSVDWLRHLTSTFSLYYNGTNMMYNRTATPVSRINYTYSNSLNGSGTTSSLIYVPKDVNDIVMVEQRDAKTNQVTYTPGDQAADLMAYIDGNKYLKSRKGKYAERGGRVAPWNNRFDFKFVQDIYSNFGTNKKYTVQITADILNVGNLLNSDWGLMKGNNNLNYNNLALLTYKGVDSQNRPTYTLAATTHDNFVAYTDEPAAQRLENVWCAMLGIRFKF